MTTKKNEVDELLGVLEDIRQKQHPDIPAELIKDILYNEFDQQDNRAKAQKSTKKLIDDYLKTIEEV